MTVNRMVGSHNIVNGWLRAAGGYANRDLKIVRVLAKAPAPHPSSPPAPEAIHVPIHVPVQQQPVQWSRDQVQQWLQSQDAEQEQTQQVVDEEDQEEGHEEFQEEGALVTGAVDAAGLGYGKSHRIEVEGM